MPDDKTPEPLIAGMVERLELWPLDRLKPYANNARTHTDDQVRKIADSIERFGFNNPILVDPTGVVCGHGRLLAAKLLKLPEVPVVPLDHLDEDTRRAYILADNRLAELADWDDDLLATELAALEAVDGLDATLTGFSADEVDRLIATLDDDGGGEPAAPAAAAPPEEPTEDPVSEPGDLWILGPHRLLVADCLEDDRAALRKLLGKTKVGAVVTDPPYAIYGSSTGVASSVTDDRAVRPMFREVMRGAEACLAQFGHAYVFCDWRSWPSWFEVCRGTTLEPSNMLVWDKGDFGLGSNYRNCHELVGFFRRVPGKTMAGPKSTGHRLVHEPNILRHLRTGQGQGFEKEEAQRYHNAAKPVDLLQKLISNSTDEGDVVVDMFLGSGSTLLACERSGRVCKGTEIEPGWADVIVHRWQTMTKGKARLNKVRGKTFDAVAKQRGRGS